MAFCCACSDDADARTHDYPSVLAQKPTDMTSEQLIEEINDGPETPEQPIAEKNDGPESMEAQGSKENIEPDTKKTEVEPKIEAAAPEEVKGLEETPSTPSTFDAKLERGEGISYGMKLNILDPSCAIISEVLAEGAVNEWNSNCSLHEVIKKSDRLVTVNGTAGDNASITEAVRTATGIVHLSLKRAQEIEVEMENVSGRFGLKLAQETENHNRIGILVTDISSDGFVAEFNSTNPDKAIHVGDRIVAVRVNSDVATDITAMEQALKAGVAKGALSMKLLSWSY
eukprot:TRINITY_DN9166_c0_g1_i4.p1 TRINITY_DN9166_c0_g1~~TRINITY_DN9166_c0_g1_i4.p1  ORF type:complete len:285 (-),score=53.30 TRINITY_DN9166_c0_g1_i4:395-1249(-)